MTPETQQARLDDAFERIEEVILPCIAMLIETLLDASTCRTPPDAKGLAAELQTLGAELEALTNMLELSSRGKIEAGAYRVAAF